MFNIKLMEENRKMNERKIKIKSKKGITLIVLIVTIVVLIILARYFVKCDYWG